MRLAVKHLVERGKVPKRDLLVAMAALETRFVEYLVISSQLLHWINSLVADMAIVAHLKFVYVKLFILIYLSFQINIIGWHCEIKIKELNS